MNGLHAILFVIVLSVALAALLIRHMDRQREARREHIPVPERIRRMTATR